MTLTISSPPSPPSLNQQSEVQPIPTLADLLSRLGDVSTERVLAVPPPGAATEADLLALAEANDRRLCELVDGILVEKAMGFHEARLASLLIGFLHVYLQETGLGFTASADAPRRLGPGLVRLPDVSYYAWTRFPGRRVPKSPVVEMAPDLAVEIISASNRRGEMDRKLGEYFAAGTRRVWYVYPEERRVRVFHSAESSLDLGQDEVLTEEELLPGFALPLREWFAGASDPGE
jgi:Uma2 family endonuclease